jgi:membrane-associated phospholipid phosphatase
MAIPSSGDDLIAAIYDVIIEPPGWDEVVNRLSPMSFRSTGTGPWQASTWTGRPPPFSSSTPTPRRRYVLRRGCTMRLYNMVARTIALQQKMLTVPEIARLFALANVAMADAGLASWDTKYFYQYWRPVTAIRLLRDPNFYPLGAQATNTAGPNFTPPFPAYTSGHATFGGALFQILRKFFPDETPFTLFRMNGTATIKMLTATSGPSGQPRSNRLPKRNGKTRKADFTWAYIGSSTPRMASNKAIRWANMYSSTPSGSQLNGREPMKRRAPRRTAFRRGSAKRRQGMEHFLEAGVRHER